MKLVSKLEETLKIKIAIDAFAAKQALDYHFNTTHKGDADRPKSSSLRPKIIKTVQRSYEAETIHDLKTIIRNLLSRENHMSFDFKFREVFNSI